MDLDSFRDEQSPTPGQKFASMDQRKSPDDLKGISRGSHMYRANKVTHDDSVQNKEIKKDVKSRQQAQRGRTFFEGDKVDSENIRKSLDPATNSRREDLHTPEIIS